jgi:hypothetical protein
MFAAGISVCHALDRRFGLKPKISMSQRDVPGISIGVVPIMHDMGVRFLSMGINEGSAPPVVPHNKPFVWRDAKTGKQIIVAIQPGQFLNAHSSPESLCDCTRSHADYSPFLFFFF